MTTATQVSPTAARATTAADHPGPPRLTRWLLRLHRPALYVYAGVVVLVTAALLLLWGPLADAAATAWAQYRACPESGGSCRYDQDAILRYKDVYQYATVTLFAVPFVTAAWAGGALFGRELESGTARLAWSLSVSPVRWFVTRLTVPAALLTTGTGLLVLLHNRAWSASQGRLDTAKPWYDHATLHTNGPTLIGITLVGLAAGACAGLLVRRTLPALALALGATTTVWLLTSQLMPHLWPSVTRVTALSIGYSGADGLLTDSGLVTSTGRHIADPCCGPTAYEGCRALYDGLDATAFYITYHPADHFWPLQLITTGLLLALAAALTLTAFLLLRRTALTTRARKETPA